MKKESEAGKCQCGVSKQLLALFPFPFSLFPFPRLLKYRNSFSHLTPDLRTQKNMQKQTEVSSRKKGGQREFLEAMLDTNIHHNKVQ